MSKPSALSAAVIALSILAVAPSSRGEEPPKSLPSESEFPWGEAASGLQCRLTPDRDVYRPDEEMRFYIQFRNAGDRELRLDPRRVFEQRLRLHLMQEGKRPETGDGFDGSAGSDQPPELVLPRPYRPVVLPLGGTVTFTLRGKSRYDRGKWFLATFLDVLGEHISRDRFVQHHQQESRYRARYTYVVQAKENQAEDSEGVWTGRVESPPAEVSIRGKRLEYGEHEQLKDEPDIGKAAGSLRTFLAPFEPRVGAGAPCWFRLRLLNEDHARARMYAPPVGIPGKGGLQVTDANAQPVPLLEQPPVKSMPLRMVDPGKSVVLCDFDLASFYDLSKPGRYLVQFPATGGKEETEVVLPASNRVEVEITEKPLSEIRRSLEPPKFTVRGTVHSEDIVVGGASVFMGSWDGEGALRVPNDMENAPGVKKAVTDQDGRFALDGVNPGAYWVVARHKDLGSAVLGFRFAKSPVERYDLALRTGEVCGQVLDRDGQTPLAGISVILLRPEQNRRWVPPVATITDGNGRFLFPGAQDGTYWVRAVLPAPRGPETVGELVPGSIRGDFEGGRIRSDPSVGSEVRVAGAKADVRLVAPQEKVAGTVRTRAGLAVSKAHVQLESKGRSEPLANRYSTEATDKGEFLFDGVVPGDYTLTVTGPALGAGGKAGRDRQSTDVQVGKGEQEKKVEIVIDTPVERQRTQVLLQLEAPDGKALGKQRARYTASAGWSSSGGLIEADGEGVVRMNLSQGAAHDVLLILAELGLWGRCAVTPGENQKELKVTLRLQKTGSVDGKVVEDGTDRPLGGVTVNAFPVSATPAQPSADRLARLAHRHEKVDKEQVSRDGDGSFRLSSLPPGEYMVSGPWHDPDCLQGRFTVKAGEVTKDVLIRKSRDAEAMTVRGRLVNADGVPVVSKEFILTSGNRDPMELSFGVRRAVTDDNGRFALYPVSPGSHEYRASLAGGKPGLITGLEVKPGRDAEETTFRVADGGVETPPLGDIGAPDSPGDWGKTVDEWRTRVSPLKASFRCWEPVIVKVEIENLGKVPRNYHLGRLQALRPDGKPVRCVSIPVQTAGERPLAVAPGQVKEWQRDLSKGDLSLSDLTMAGKYRVRYVSWAGEGADAPPPSNVAEFEILPPDPKEPLPPVQAALPPGLVDALDSVIPEKWELSDVDGLARPKEDFSEPRRVFIRYTRSVGTQEALEIGQKGMKYCLFLYDLRYKGQDPIEKHRAEKRELRLLGQTEWYRVYAAYGPDARLGWKDPDGDIIRALKLKRP